MNQWIQFSFARAILSMIKCRIEKKEIGNARTELNEVIGERLNKKYDDGREKLKIISDFFSSIVCTFRFRPCAHYCNCCFIKLNWIKNIGEKQSRAIEKHIVDWKLEIISFAWYRSKVWVLSGGRQFEKNSFCFCKFAKLLQFPPRTPTRIVARRGKQATDSIGARLLMQFEIISTPFWTRYAKSRLEKNERKKMEDKGNFIIDVAGSHQVNGEMNAQTYDRTHTISRILWIAARSWIFIGREWAVRFIKIYLINISFCGCI